MRFGCECSTNRSTLRKQKAAGRKERRRKAGLKQRLRSESAFRRCLHQVVVLIQRSWKGKNWILREGSDYWKNSEFAWEPLSRRRGDILRSTGFINRCYCNVSLSSLLSAPHASTLTRYLSWGVHSEVKWREYNRFFFFLRDIQLHLTCKQKGAERWKQTLIIVSEGDIEVL